jgi:hypothetical protein
MQARAQSAALPATQSQLSAKQTRLARVRRAREEAVRNREQRRAVQLSMREQRVGRDVERLREAQTLASLAEVGDERTRGRGGPLYTREQEAERARFLDTQAALPSSRERLNARAGSDEEGTAPARRRDYAALAGLVGIERDAYERLDPGRRRQARLEIDRQLALRRELNGPVSGGPGGGGRQSQSRERPLDGEVARAPARRPQAYGRTQPGSSDHDRAPQDPWQIEARRRARESPVMRDAREVAERRKRQLGWPAGR